MSVLGALAHEAGTQGVPFLIIGEACPSGDLTEARNRVTAHFLDHTDAEWLWWADADMGFEPDMLTRLIDAADPDARPVVGALCFGLRKAGDDPTLNAYSFECFPTLYAWEERGDEVGFRGVVDYPEDTLVEVGATGAACFVVHRTVLEKIRANYGEVWFDKVTHPTGRRFSEDLSFFVRVAGVGVPPFVHTGIPTAHDKGDLPPRAGVSSAAGDSDGLEPLGRQDNVPVLRHRRVWHLVRLIVPEPEGVRRGSGHRCKRRDEHASIDELLRSCDRSRRQLPTSGGDLDQRADLEVVVHPGSLTSSQIGAGLPYVRVLQAEAHIDRVGWLSGGRSSCTSRRGTAGACSK